LDIQDTLVDLFDRTCGKYADNQAYTSLGHTITFKELDELAQNFAAYIQQHTTLEPGDRLAVQLPNLLQYPVVVFGALRAGLIVVNTNPLYTQDELTHQLEDSGAKALVVLKTLGGTAQKVIAHSSIKYFFVTSAAEFHPPVKRFLINLISRLKAKSATVLTGSRAIPFATAIEIGAESKYRKIQVDQSSVAVLQYTGGTTGIAKGAMLTHRNLVCNMTQLRDHVPDLFHGEGSNLFCAPLPLYHIYAFNLHMLCAFSMGRHNLLLPNPRDLGSVVKAFKKYSPNVFVGLNTLYIALLNDVKFRQIDFSSLHYCSAGGMALNQDTAERWQSLTGCEILEGYGLTETSPVVSSNQIGEVKLGTIGKAVPHTEVKVIDAEGNMLKNGQPGEICIRGPQVMKGYWQNEEATANVLDTEGWLKTGDVGVIDDEGYIKIVDRIKDMIIVSGFNVYPNEVEDVATKHPKVVECAVVGIPDERRGEAVKMVVVATDSSLTEHELDKFLHEHLSGYKVPDLYEFRDELPKSNVGKVLRRELR